MDEKNYVSINALHLYCNSIAFAVIADWDIYRDLDSKIF